MLGRCKGLLLPSSRLYTSCGHAEAQKLKQLPPALTEAKAAMEAALEHVHYLRESAHQAFLECEPHRRETSEAYLMRYQTFAKQELEAALTQFESAEQSGGAGWADAVAAAQMPLLVADSRLAKDNLTAALRLNAERIKRRQEALLAGENVASAYRPDEDPCKPAWQQPMP